MNIGKGFRQIIFFAHKYGAPLVVALMFLFTLFYVLVKSDIDIHYPSKGGVRHESKTGQE